MRERLRRIIDCALELQIDGYASDLILRFVAAEWPMTYRHRNPLVWLERRSARKRAGLRRRTPRPKRRVVAGARPDHWRDAAL